MPATNSVFADAAIDDVASASLPLLLFPLDLNDGGGTHGTSMRLFRHLRDPNFDVMFNALHLSDIITDGECEMTGVTGVTGVNSIRDSNP
jgi:hypothetical protein